MRRAVLATFLLLQALPLAADPTFDAKGFNPNRAGFQGFPFERIDPLTGNLMLSFTDLVLPGDGGLDLVIQRTYNSKIYTDYFNLTVDADSWAGVGWTFHLGKVSNAESAHSGPVVIELSDGSAHAAYPHPAPPLLCESPCFVTKEHWLYSKTTQQLFLPNGRRYTFNRFGTHPSSPQLVRYVTEIRDLFNNTISIDYYPAPAPVDAIRRITQPVGGATRYVDFDLNGDGRLRRMRANNREWNYNVTGTGAASRLMSFTPPDGRAWTFDYFGALTHLTMPYGATLVYGYNEYLFAVGTGYARSLAVRQRTLSSAQIAPATWYFTYGNVTIPGGQQVVSDTTTIRYPCDPPLQANECRTEIYKFDGVGPFATASAPWKVGLLRSVEVQNQLGLRLELRELSWRQSLQALSNTQETIGSLNAPQIFVPRLTEVLTTRWGPTFTPRQWRTTYQYRTTNYEDFNRPWKVVDTGERTRTTTYDYEYAFGGAHVLDKTKQESVEVLPETPYVRSWRHRTNGFLDQETIYGVTTNFVPTAAGDVYQKVDARGSTTTNTYQYGAESSVTVTGNYGTTFRVVREINWEGLVRKQTSRGWDTWFTYDGLGRVASTTPPAGAWTTFLHDVPIGSEFVTQRLRGGTLEQTHYDAAGRTTREVDAMGIARDTTYDSYSRVTFESYPYDPADAATGTPKGATTVYDALGRRVRVTHGDGKYESWTYDDGANKMTHRDERNMATESTYASFGDPDDRVLLTSKDANSVVTTYAYTALNRLRSASGAASGTRTWEYNARNQLWRETHPENGATTYTFDAVGNVETATDADNQVLGYTYDASNRMRTRTGTNLLDGFGYDEAGNLTTITSNDVTIYQQFDELNRLSTREDTTRQHTLSTWWSYDALGRLERVQYPSNSVAATGTFIRYERDNAGRITKVEQRNGADQVVRTLASGFVYHPSGQPNWFVVGDTRIWRTDFDDRHRPRGAWTSGPGQDPSAPALWTEWGRDEAGNVTSITDVVRPTMNQGITYDNLNRITTITGYMPGTYGYTAANNRVSRTGNGQSVSFTVDGATNRLQSISGTGAIPQSFQYTASGSLDRRYFGPTNVETRYRYTPTGMLSSVEVPSSGQTWTYAYDGEGLRALRSSGTTTLRYVHDASGKLLSEYDISGTRRRWRADYVYLDDRLLAKVGCDVTILQPVLLVGQAGGTFTVPITTPDGCAWKASNLPGGATTQETIGVGIGPISATVPLTIAANGSGGPVTTMISVGPRQFRLTQGSTQCFAEITPASADIPDAGTGAGDRSFQVNAPAGCNWTATVTQQTAPGGWVRTVSGAASGVGNGVVRYVVDANTGTAARTGTISVSGPSGWGAAATHTLNQQPQCIYAITPAAGPWLTSGPWPAGQAPVVSFTVVPNRSNCTWAVTGVNPPSATWLSPAPGETLTGTGQRTVQLAVASNPSTTPRSAAVVITGGATHTVWQAGVSSPALGIDSPAPNAVLPTGPFRLSGYAADLAAPPQLGAGVAQMAVYVNGVLQPPVVMHQYHALAAQLGGPQFANAGYYVDLNLPAGTHTVIVYMQSATSGQITSLSRVVVVNRPPSVSIPAPSNPYVVHAGTPVTLVSSAADPDPGDSIARVEYYASAPGVGNNVFIGQSTVGPSFALPLGTPPAGTYSIIARAYDTRGFSAASTPMSLVVNALPTIAIISAGSQLRAAVALQANAPDTDGPGGQAVTVEYFFGATPIGSSSAGYPFTAWLYNAPPGIYSITARATDSRGAQAWSAPFTLTIY